MRGVEPEVGADVGQSRREDAAREQHAGGRAEDRLVGEVDDDLRRAHLERPGEVVVERDAVVLPAPELLRAADHQRAGEGVRELGERVADDRRVVLAVDHRERASAAHERVVTSLTIAPVCLWYSSVLSENSSSRSRPWNGYFRQTVTVEPWSSITL